MIKRLKYLLLAILVNVGFTLSSQNQGAKWYFGDLAGLDFMTTPPTILTGSMNALEGCSSISNNAGNLLFYSDGVNIWNQTHAVMSNGSLLYGNPTTSQCGVIVKQPGSSTIYNVFALAATGGTDGLTYSVVDMALSAGMGSVTSKNNFIYAPSTEKLTAARHCNGVDIWVVSHEYNTNNFVSHLVTATGVNTVGIISACGPTFNTLPGTQGCMKISPNGKKLGMVALSINSAVLFDFDAATGIVSNSLALPTTAANYGCEFSSDGTKFYCSEGFSANKIYQWDLCAGSNAAVVSSVYTTTSTSAGQMQLAPDGKIYVSRISTQSLGVINNPNIAGSGCNYNNTGQSIAPRYCQYGLPNFITSLFKPPPPPFTYTAACQTASFTPPASPNTTLVNCVSTGYSVTSVLWNFGDPSTGPANTSTALNPVHMYSSLGTFTAKLVMYYSCGGGTDTIIQPVSLNQSCTSFSAGPVSCASPGSATIQALSGFGPFSYLWMPSGQTSSVATGLVPGIYTISIYSAGNNSTYSVTAVFNSSITGNVTNSSSVSCNGANNATASIAVSGGSGSQTYTWTNGMTSQNSATAIGLSAGAYTVSVVDALTFCAFTQTFQVSQPPALSVNIASGTATSCVGSNVSFTAAGSGGIPGPGPGYTYSWTAGPFTNTYLATSAISGTRIFTVTARDFANCPRTQTVSVVFVANPTLAILNASICPLQSGTLFPSGASSYTFYPAGTNGLSFSASPSITTAYTVVGAASGCTSAPATASIVIKPIPLPTLASNGPVCAAENLALSGSGGSSYSWNGPLGFSSFLQNPVIGNFSVNKTGIYSLTVTAVNSCTAATSISVGILPTPLLTAAGNTVCINQALSFFSNSSAGNAFSWSGPNSFTSSVQNPSITSSQTVMSGVYTVTVTSAQGCTNSASANVLVTNPQLPVIAVNSTTFCVGAVINLGGSGGNSYIWSGPNGFTSNLQNPVLPGISVAATGMYTLLVTTGPCVTTATRSLTVYALPTTVAGYVPACETKSMQLTASGTNLSYTWSGPLSFTSVLQNPVINAVALTHSGSYSVTATDNNNCRYTAIAQVTVMQNPLLTVTNATVCSGKPVVLYASGAATYTWSGPSGYTSFSANANIPSANSATTQYYSVVGAGVNTCTNVIISLIQTLPLPVPSLVVSPPRTCLNNSITLEGFGGNTYEWKGPASFFTTRQNVVFTASNLSYSGIFTLTAFNAYGCSDYTTAVITIDPLPQGDLVSDIKNYCVPFCGNFGLKSLNVSPIVNSVWEINKQIFAAPAFNYCALEPGNFIVNGTFLDAVGCSNTATFEIYAYPVPRANFEFIPEKPVEGQDEVLFTNTTSGEQLRSFAWFFVNNNGYKTASKNASYLFRDAGIYPVALVAKNAWGCSDTTISTVAVEPDFNIFVPNTFTPNDDFKNDLFLPKGNGIVTYHMAIYSRWGEKVFETTDVNTGWDGSYKGEDCKSDVYTWKIYITHNKQKSKSLSGFVTLYR